MPSVHVDKVGEMAIIECAGRFVRTETALKLQDAVTSQTDAQVVVLDLTEMHAIGGGGVGVLVLLQRWAHDHGIRFKLFNPSGPVRNKLKHINCEIATLEQMMTLLSRVDGEYARALLSRNFRRIGCLNILETMKDADCFKLEQCEPGPLWRLIPHSDC